jgi:hypothetical protein
MNDYRQHQLRELLEAWHRGDARLSDQQLKSLVGWENTPGEDLRRLEAALSARAESQLSLR